MGNDGESRAQRLARYLEQHATPRKKVVGKPRQQKPLPAKLDTEQAERVYIPNINAPGVREEVRRKQREQENRLEAMLLRAGLHITQRRG